MGQPIKCINCGNDKQISRLFDAQNIHAITALNISEEVPNFKSGSGVPVDLYMCPECNFLMPFARKLN